MKFKVFQDKINFFYLENFEESRVDNKNFINHSLGQPNIANKLTC